MFPLLKKAMTIGFVAALVFGVAAAAVASHVLFTASGSERAVTWLLTHYVRSDDVAIQRAHGSLVRGLSLYDMEVKGLAGLPPGTVLHLQQLDLPALARLKDMTIAARQVRMSLPTFAEAVTAERVTGSVLGGFSLYDLEVNGLHGLPDGAVLKAQRVDAAAPFRLERIRAIYNGRLQLPYSDPVVFSGTQDNQRVDVQLYSKQLDVREWLEIVSASKVLRNVSGNVADAQLHVSGSLTDPVVDGTFHISRVAHRGFAVSHCPGSLRLRVHGLGESTRVNGDIACQAGTITKRDTTVRLRPSRIVYTGDPRTPSLDLHGTAAVEGTAIALTLTGTMAQPKLTLSSNPPLSQKRLLLMVATGKSWKEAEVALSQGQLSTDLVKDFLDYFVLGGLGSKLTRSFGISDISLTYDSRTRARGLGVKLGDRVGTQYEIQPGETLSTHEPPQSIGEQPLDLHKVGVEYRVTDNTSLELEGQKEVPPERQQSQPVDPTQKATNESDEQLLLKIKRQF